MSGVYPVFLAGGAGTRLWPLSRKSYPKQFSRFINKHSLFQQTVLRLQTSDTLNFFSPTILTNSDFRFVVGDQLNEIAIQDYSILVEPESKNTSPSILAACLRISGNDPDAIVLVSPTDHIIPDKLRFHDIVKAGLDQLNDGKIVIFGITPTHAETGYGYIKIDTQKLDEYGTSRVLKFVEKPCKSVAEEMFSDKSYLWNAGIFLCKVKDLIEVFQRFQPEAYKYVAQSLRGAKIDLDFLRLDAENWAKLENVSIDYAVMEKADNLLATPFPYSWSDLGDWNAVWSQSHKDELGNAVGANSEAIDCKDTMLRAEDKNQHLVGIGLQNIVAVAMRDAVLVMDRERAQQVKGVVDYLNSQNISPATTFPKDYRPWGWFESLSIDKSFQVKRICVKPGGKLSLQSHNYRSEHWVIVEGTAHVEIEGEISRLLQGQSIYVPQGAKHRLENRQSKPMVLIEVQIGTYFGEDDIVRYEDVYNR